MNIDAKITPRLRMAALLTPKCEAVADIGTDHGYLPIYLVQKGICERAVAADINAGPLAAASRNIALYGMSSEIETVLSDGLKNIDCCDVAVIAGMGGELIAEILKSRKGNMTRFVLQPQRSFEVLRFYLAENGFEIKKESVAEEGRRMYCAFYAEYTARKRQIDLAEALCGRKELFKDESLFEKYMIYRRNIVLSALGNMDMAKSGERREQLEKLVNIYTEMIS